MTIIDEKTVVVFSSAELKTVLENNNEYNMIYLGADITLASGITISSSKTKVTIDGTYQGTTYSFTDLKSTSYNNTISVNAAMPSLIVVKNMNITGYNYYGVIYVPEASNYQKTVVEYDNITYIGPQISFHPYGLTRFLNVNITIQDNYSTGNEVCECNQIEIGGTSRIVHKSTSNSSFWFRNANPSFIILAGADVHFTSVARELFYGVNNLKFSVLKGAYFEVQTAGGMGYGKFGTGISVIEEKASFVLRKTAYNGGYATWYSYGTITLNESSTLSIINDYAGITSSNYNIYFSSAAAGFVCNNPQKLLLYNTVANVIYSTTNIPFSFQFSRLNLFQSAINYESDISLANLPTYAWYKTLDLAMVTGTFNASSTTVSGSNFTEAELETLPDLTNFVFQNKKIFSIGKVFFRINALTDVDTSMSGLTESLASILIQYDNISTVINAFSDGAFKYSYDSPLPLGTKITFQVKKKDDLLYHTKVIEVIYPGEITIDSATNKVKFVLKPISLKPLLCPKEEELVITVTDSRVNSTDWKLYATIDHELTSLSGLNLRDSLVFLQSDGNLDILSSTPTLVYQGTSNAGIVKTTKITWKVEEGILLQIVDNIANGVEYSATIIWNVEE